MGWHPRASIELTDHLLVIWAQQIDVVCSSADALLKSTASMIVVVRETRVTQPGREVESGALFLRVVGSVQLYWVSVKGCHVRATAHRKRTSGVRGLT
jgi:hypothetical protein